MNFGSDNISGIHPKILEAIVEGNKGTDNSYGGDASTAALKEKLKEVFEHDLVYYFASTGTAANCLALSALCPPYGTILCSDSAHILTDECTAPYFFTGGARLMHRSKSPSKFDPKLISETINFSNYLRPHAGKPVVVSIAQTTELGQVYTLEEIKEICDEAHKYGLKVHMDGARFANALVNLNCTPAEMSWKAGVDVLTFGATKNGGLHGELIIFFNPSDAENFDFIHKRSGQLMSKTRFFAMQMLAYLKDDLWLELARHSNAMAKRLADGVKDVPCIKPWLPLKTNEFFIVLPKELAEKLYKAGAHFYEWEGNLSLYRWVTSWQTTEKEVDDFVALIKSLL
ncbi:threonine aldolase, putative [Trichomonas vaginalis G3]|uniref:Threonine aldolase, putative n=1 Tax=Trichomonas vaginalis (strain ATCC PRA-98 / G3) TaxID=412133 RepID=A2FP13_TRIV3|nr:L-threonine aldolase-related family [Trichomonas vaginalis G3]EAX93354.1 threonine aldolase, putative [Trichomonas vaginalis G3]KAI5518003.1 L-threonine aldolase-related family [Trichomonas vaginalis G3]|eukprot:XP_001306284.1 threonine aldolase [Trichomonas vaginalis G3]